MVFNNAFICDSSVLIFHYFICPIVLAIIGYQLVAPGDRISAEELLPTDCSMDTYIGHFSFC